MSRPYSIKKFTYTTTCPILTAIAEHLLANEITLTKLSELSGYCRLKYADWMKEKFDPDITPRYTVIRDTLQALGMYLERDMNTDPVKKMVGARMGRDVHVNIKDDFLFSLFSEALNRGYTLSELSRRITSPSGKKWNHATWSTWARGDTDPPFCVVKALATFLSYNLIVMKR